LIDAEGANIHETRWAAIINALATHSKVVDQNVIRIIRGIGKTRCCGKEITILDWNGRVAVKRGKSVSARKSER
jgi:hypothetical protein